MVSVQAWRTRRSLRPPALAAYELFGKQEDGVIKLALKP
jgi:hypothetical protein